MRSRLWHSLLIIAIIICGIGAGFFIRLGLSDPSQSESTPQDLPTMELTLSDITLDELNAGDKTTRYPGNALKLTENGETYKYTDVEIKGRGNSTWGPAKKPYQIKFANKVDLFNMGKTRKWVLIASAFDSTHLRNDVAFYISRLLGEEYALSGEYVKLYINGEDLGLYYLTHKIEVEKSVVNLQDPLGVLVELDNLHRYEGTCRAAASGDCFGISDLVNDDNLEPAIADFIATYDQLVVAIKAKDYETVESLIDVESFAKYFLLNEFTVNPDAYSTSFFMYKDGVNDKIHAGPGWDFDFALGNREWVWNDGDNFYSPENDLVMEAYAIGDAPTKEQGLFTEYLDPNISHLVFGLLHMPKFRAEVERVYQETMSGRADELISWVSARAAQIETAATANNFQWGKDDFYASVAELTNWVERRYAHFEATYGTFSPEITDPEPETSPSSAPTTPTEPENTYIFKLYDIITEEI